MKMLNNLSFPIPKIPRISEVPVLSRLWTNNTKQPKTSFKSKVKSLSIELDKDCVVNLNSKRHTLSFRVCEFSIETFPKIKGEKMINVECFTDTNDIACFITIKQVKKNCVTVTLSLNNKSSGIEEVIVFHDIKHLGIINEITNEYLSFNGQKFLLQKDFPLSVFSIS